MQETKGKDIPVAVKRAVRALCEDYDRRAKEIKRGVLQIGRAHV